jgi:hypothetical protein
MRFTIHYFNYMHNYGYLVIDMDGIYITLFQLWPEVCYECKWSFHFVGFVHREDTNYPLV